VSDCLSTTNIQPDQPDEACWKGGEDNVAAHCRFTADDGQIRE